MKHVEFKVVPIQRPGQEDGLLDYRTQLQAIMRNPLDPNRGADFEEVRQSVRVLEALDKAGADGCDLEDADYNYMCSKVKATRFSFVHPAVLEFVESVTSQAGGRGRP